MKDGINWEIQINLNARELALCVEGDRMSFRGPIAQDVIRAFWSLMALSDGPLSKLPCEGAYEFRISGHSEGERS